MGWAKAGERAPAFTIVAQTLNPGVTVDYCVDTICKPVAAHRGDAQAIRALAEYDEAIAYLQKSPTAVGMLARVTGSVVLLIDATSTQGDAILTDGAGHWMPVWNPKLSLVCDAGGISPAVALIHEIGHAVHDIEDVETTNELYRRSDVRYDNAEEARTIVDVEQPVARELGESARKDHRGAFVAVKDTRTVGDAPSEPVRPNYASVTPVVNH